METLLLNKFLNAHQKDMWLCDTWTNQRTDLIAKHQVNQEVTILSSSTHWMETVLYSQLFLYNIPILCISLIRNFGWKQS